MNYLKMTAVGRVTADAKHFAANGDKRAMTTFAIAVNVTAEKVTYVEAELRGDRAEKLAQFLTKGKEVLVTGQPFATAYASNGGEPKASLKLYVDDIQLGAGGAGSADPV